MNCRINLFNNIIEGKISAQGRHATAKLKKIILSAHVRYGAYI